MSDRLLDTIRRANLHSIEFAARAKGESGTQTAPSVNPASANGTPEALGRGNSPTNNDEEECISCGSSHVPVPGLYLGRDRYACSENCWDEYVQWGRYQR